MRTSNLSLWLCLLLGCNRTSPDEPRPRLDDAAAATQPASPTPAPTPTPTPGLSFNRDASAYTRTLAEVDTELAATRARADTQTKSWLALEKLANLYLRRARLSGSYDDYAAAREALDEAFERAPEGTGPVLTRASLEFTLHRLAQVEPNLVSYERIPTINKPTQALIAGMRGDVAFEQGQYARARELYDAALALAHSPGLLSKLAQLQWRTGAFDDAERLYAEARELMPATALEARAWIDLQLGLMDLERGRYDDAFAHYRDGAELLGGWWLLEEHIAEIAAIQHRDAFALELYDSIIARTGKAEFLDAKAGLLARAGDAAGAANASEQAATIYAAELGRFPEASYGHALAHYLEFGPPARALELATANYELRPGVPAMIALAQARLGVDDVDGAREIIDLALASGWVSAELSWVGSQVYAKLGQDARAAELRREAEALHPTIATDG